MGRPLQRQNTRLSETSLRAFTNTTGLEESCADEMLTNLAYALEDVITFNDVAAYHGFPLASITPLLSDAGIRMLIKKKRVELVNSGSVMRKTALAALHKNKDRLNDFLSSDLNVAAHIQVANLAYRISGLEAEDKRPTKKAGEGEKFSITINLGRNSGGEPKTINITTPVQQHGTDDAIDGKLVGEE